MPDEENDTNEDEQSNAFAESVFLGEIAERANDRVLADIRTFNGAAIALLGPILAIVAFVDYRDRWNILAALFSVAAAGSAMVTVFSGDGTPTPLLNSRFFEDFKTDPDDARRNVIADLALLGPENTRQSQAKRLSLRCAGILTVLAIVGAISAKMLELR